MNEQTKAVLNEPGRIAGSGLGGEHRSKLTYDRKVLHSLVLPMTAREKIFLRFALYAQLLAMLVTLGEAAVSDSRPSISIFWGIRVGARTAMTINITAALIFLDALFLEIVLGIQSLLYWFRNQARQKRIARGLCYACGYDMRGSQQKCPECGSDSFQAFAASQKALRRQNDKTA